jgi:hypothetical protein
MSENAFFPLVLLAFLAFVRALERPSAGRQLVALISTVPAIAVRSEGLVLIAVFVCSIVLTAVSCADRNRSRYLRSLGREFRKFGLTLIVLPLSVVVLIGGEAAVGRSPGAVLGRYAGSFGTYPVRRTLHWAVYQVIDLEFYLAVLPFVPATIVAVALLWRRGIARSQRAVAATAICSAMLFILAAAAASQSAQGGPPFNYPYLPPNLHDRYCFFVAPLFLILFLYWVQHRHEFSNRVLVPLLIAAAALPLVLPYADVHGNADFDSLALLPWHNRLIADRNVHLAMAVTVVVLALVLIPRRPAFAVAQVVVVTLMLWLVGAVARSDIAQASTAAPTSHGHQRSWVDAAAAPGSKVAVLWMPEGSRSLRNNIKQEQALWRTEFLNPSIRSFFFVNSPMNYDLPAARARLIDGRLATANEEPYRYVLTDSAVRLSGKVVRRDRLAHLTLYRTREGA